MENNKLLLGEFSNFVLSKGKAVSSKWDIINKMKIICSIDQAFIDIVKEQIDKLVPLYQFLSNNAIANHII